MAGDGRDELRNGIRYAVNHVRKPGFTRRYGGGRIVNRTQQEIPNAETMKQTESHAVKIVVEAARRLL